MRKAKTRETASRLKWYLSMEVYDDDVLIIDMNRPETGYSGRAVFICSSEDQRREVEHQSTGECIIYSYAGGETIYIYATDQTAMEQARLAMDTYSETMNHWIDESMINDMVAADNVLSDYYIVNAEDGWKEEEKGRYIGYTESKFAVSFTHDYKSDVPYVNLMIRRIVRGYAKHYRTAKELLHRAGVNDLVTIRFGHWFSRPKTKKPEILIAPRGYPYHHENIINFKDEGGYKQVLKEGVSLVTHNLECMREIVQKITDSNLRALYDAQEEIKDYCGVKPKIIEGKDWGGDIDDQSVYLSDPCFPAKLVYKGVEVSKPDGENFILFSKNKALLLMLNKQMEFEE